MAQLHKALCGYKGRDGNKQLEEERVERDCNSPSLHWFILPVNRPKKQASRNKPGRLAL